MFEGVKDEILLKDCKEAVGKEKKATARVLEYLSEIDSRRLWASEGYSSLFDFCIRFLGYSEAETCRRTQAARLSSRIEEVKPLLEEGTLSLTSMSLLSKHLTKENAKEILPQVVNLSTRQVEKVIEHHFPESKKKDVFKADLDEELMSLLDKARKRSGEKDSTSLLRKVLRAYTREKATRVRSVKRHTRYVQVPLAREVKRQAGYQCSYKSKSGVRCNQTAHLQTDHVRPWAKGGSSRDIDNLRCLCRAHNLMLAKRDFPKWQKPNGQVTSGQELLPKSTNSFPRVSRR
jgi:hypothetical protein